MSPVRIVVFLPCHTLDDFPSWLEEAEADDLLAAWTAAWDPRLLSAVGRTPEWASVDLPPPVDEPIVGIVPAAFDPRFAAQVDALGTTDSRWVRRVRGTAALGVAARAAAGLEEDAARPALTEDFRALGLAVLLAERLARRMRSEAALEATGFAAAAVAAARAAIANRVDEARDRLRECFGYLAAARSRYYPVDLWLVDLVLLADTTLGRPLLEELDAPTPLGVVATGELIERLAAEHPAALARLRERCAAGTVAACGGRDSDEPLALATPEQVAESFARGRAAWQRHLGTVPRTFARVAGGGSPLVPAVLEGLGYLGAVWPLFDGTSLPDPGTARLRWEGAGGSVVETIARPPLDVREARTILALPERLGDAMDHDHVAVVTFAHYAGTGSPWHAVLQRIGSWSDALGTFVTTDELFPRTDASGAVVAFEPDAFPVPQPPAATDGDPLAAAVAAAAAEARRIVAAAAALRPLLAVPAVPAAGDAASGPRPRTGGRWPWSRRREAGDLVLENGLVRLEAHPRTGGLLSLRRPCDRGNRISQQLAVRTTRPSATAWDSPADRAAYGRMQADAVARVKTAAGGDAIESRGRLLTADGAEAGSFAQRMWLVPGLPLAVLDLDVHGDRAAPGPLAEQHVACRFAWNENEDVDLLRSLHTQAIATERTRFTADHFLTIRGGGRAAGADDVTILTGGLPWHLRSSPHVVDSILAATAGAAVRRLAVGIGLDQPWVAALRLLADAPLDGPPTGLRTARFTAAGVDRSAPGIERLTIGLLEMTGRAGEVRIEWATEPLAAHACDLAGRPREGVAVAIEGRTTIVFLRRYEWLHLQVDFPA